MTYYCGGPDGCGEVFNTEIPAAAGLAMLCHLIVNEHNDTALVRVLSGENQP